MDGSWFIHNKSVSGAGRQACLLSKRDVHYNTDLAMAMIPKKRCLRGLGAILRVVVVVGRLITKVVV
jgi:hypothetical protein